MAQKQGRAVPKPQPQTLAEVIEKLQIELDALGTQIRADREAVHQKELKASNIAGQLQAYSSLQIDNPAEVEHGSEIQPTA